MPQKINRLIEPFAGMAAISIAVAKEKRAEKFHFNDINRPIIDLLQTSIENPLILIEDYTKVWNEQFTYPAGHIEHFYHIRDIFNLGEQTPANMLYLLARCVKGAVRYGKNGKFNQSPDKRRHGTNPKNIANNVTAISNLLKGRTTFSCIDYYEILKTAKSGDLVYMDPPYQGVCYAHDNRYCSGVNFYEFSAAVKLLNNRNIDYLISYDGECGGKVYGEELPADLRCKKIMLNAGISAQATLLGQKQTTFESLYLSENLFFEKPALIGQNPLYGGAL